jgi:hypothetical protein
MLGSSGLSIFKDRSVAVYNPTKLSLSINNVLIKGFSENDVVNIEYLSDTCIFVKGIDGNTAIQKQLNFDATITLSLLQTAQVNKQLLELSEKFKLAGQASQLTFSDYNLGVSWATSFAVLQTRPSFRYGASSQSFDWKFYCPNMKMSQQIASSDSMLTLESLLFKKIKEGAESIGKTISGIYS